MFTAVLCVAAAALGQSTLPAIFVANNVSDEITVFTVNPDRTLDLVGTFPTNDGPQAIDVSPDGRHVVVGHGTTSSDTEVLRVFRVNPDATLTDLTSALIPDSPLDALWISNTVVAATETNLGPPNFVHTWQLDEEFPALGLVDTAVTGSFNSALALRGDGILYTQDSTSDAITWFQAALDGNLEFMGTLATAPVFPLELALTPSGSYLYAACGISGDGHRVLGFAVDAAGSLTILAGSPFFSPGQSPAHLAASADGAWLFVGHGTDATLRSFSIDPESGSIAATGFVFDVGLQGTLGDIAVLDDLVLVTDESTATDGVSGLYGFHLQPDGTLVPVAPIYDSMGVRPESIAAWGPDDLTGDLDGDGVVGILDFLALLGAWGPCPRPCPPTCTGDVDVDCAVSITDLLLVLRNWS